MLLQGAVLSAFALQAHGKHIARRAVQHVVRRGAQQQCQAMATVTANHDQVALLLLGEVVDFLAWLAIGQVAIGAFEFAVLVFQALKSLLGLVELLLLQL